MDAYPLVTREKWEVEKNQYSAGHPQVVYHFADVRPGESKRQYFARKDLTRDPEFVRLLASQFAPALQWLGFQDLVPEDLGGEPEWLVSFQPAPLRAGSAFMLQAPKQYPLQFSSRPCVVVPTTASKKDYYAVNRLAREEVMDLIRLAVVKTAEDEKWEEGGSGKAFWRTGPFFGDGTALKPFLDHLIPPTLLPGPHDSKNLFSEWNVRDYSKENAARKKEYEDEMKLGRERAEKARIRRNQSARDKRARAKKTEEEEQYERKFEKDCLPDEGSEE